MSVPARHAKPSSLARYEAMCRAIEAAYKVDEVKDIRDQAIALEVYARQAHNTEAERKACEIRLRAERKAGALSAKLEKSAGGRPGKTRATRDRVSTKAEQLHAAGVTPRQAKSWEKLAAVPEKEFEMALEDQTAKPTTNGIIKANRRRRGRCARPGTTRTVPRVAAKISGRAFRSGRAELCPPRGDGRKGRRGQREEIAPGRSHEARLRRCVGGVVGNPQGE